MMPYMANLISLNELYKSKNVHDATPKLNENTATHDAKDTELADFQHECIISLPPALHIIFSVATLRE